MDVYMMVLRIVHIAGAIFWVGSAVIFFFFLEPTAKTLGPQAQPFVKQLVETRRLPLYIITANLLVVISGILMYWRDSAGFRIEWITSATGLAFSIGGIAGIAATFVGGALIRPAVERFGALGDRLAAAGRPPTEEELRDVETLQSTLRRYGAIDVALLMVGVVTMATARYLS